MLCQQCQKNTATTYLQRTVNGHTTVLHLCNECATKQQSALWNGLDFGDFWGHLFTDPTVKSSLNTKRCEGCGHSFHEITSMGYPGCPQCYQTFFEELMPSIERIHGKAHHVGKIPVTADNESLREHKLEELKKQLNDCVVRQEYEQCAALRDQIRELEQSKGEGEYYG